MCAPWSTQELGRLEMPVCGIPVHQGNPSLVHETATAGDGMPETMFGVDVIGDLGFHQCCKINVGNLWHGDCRDHSCFPSVSAAIANVAGAAIDEGGSLSTGSGWILILLLGRLWAAGHLVCHGGDCCSKEEDDPGHGQTVPAVNLLSAGCR